MKVLVTGNAGFIGFHTAKKLLEQRHAVVGFDVVNDYYDPCIKEARLKILEATAAQTGSDYEFIRANLADRRIVAGCFEQHQFERVIQDDIQGRVLALDESAARAAAVLSERRKTRGTPIEIRDAMIAGIAISRRAELATRNVRHFQRVPELTVENWIDEI